jgi:Lamin Tail Domain
MRVMRLGWWLLFCASCAQLERAGVGRDQGAAAEDLSSPSGVDLAQADAGPGGGGGGDAATRRDLAQVTYGDGGLCGPKINEVQTSVSGDARWEFVELYNPCGDFDLTGWTLVYRSATDVAPRDGNDSQTLYTFSQTVPHGGFLVITGPSAGYTGPSDGMLAGLGLADDGAVGLRDASAHLADSVAYGAVSAGNAFIEGTAAGKPPRTSAPGQSIARKPDGEDSNNNSTDFAAGTPTPGGHN